MDFEPPLAWTIVIPCLNEAETLGRCIQRAQSAIKRLGLSAEVLVADNGSTDGSVELAEASGARVVKVLEKGYGNALMGGIRAARGRFILMADADDSYHLDEIDRMVEAMPGHDLVQGCRLPAGGGRIETRAMPLSHRWLGNPLLTLIARLLFSLKVNDIYCGMRAFRKEEWKTWGQLCPGMEFATEMLIQAVRSGARIAEVPVTLYRDGRKSRAPHLRTIRDGWRTLRLFLLLSPGWLFFWPGVVLTLGGVLGVVLQYVLWIQGGAGVDVPGVFGGCLVFLFGVQILVFGLLGRTFSVVEGFTRYDGFLRALYQWLNLEKVGLFSVFVGLLGWGWLIVQLRQHSTADRLDHLILAGTMAYFSLQLISSAFLVSMLGFRNNAKFHHESH
jgi:glycosyltransferase involved in cell wall biosynthesis